MGCTSHTRTHPHGNIKRTYTYTLDTKHTYTKAFKHIYTHRLIGVNTRNIYMKTLATFLLINTYTRSHEVLAAQL